MCWGFRDCCLGCAVTGMGEVVVVVGMEAVRIGSVRRASLALA